jgi:hypothetical protein
MLMRDSMSQGDMCGCGAQECPNLVVSHNNGYGPADSGGLPMEMWGVCPPLETPDHEDPSPMLESSRPSCT